MLRAKEEKNFENISKSINNFTVNFHKSIAEKADGNFVCSPLSAHTVLSMTAYGAEGRTKDQMWKTLHLPENDELAQREFQTLIDTFNALKGVDHLDEAELLRIYRRGLFSSPIDSTVVKVANKIYTSHSMEIKEQFKEITSTYFRSESDALDFCKKVEAADEINKWCDKQTNGKIQDIINPDMLTPDTRMILLNAVYFKSNWDNEFNESYTERKPFHVNKTTTILVPTMTMHEDLYYKQLKDLNAKIVGLPYENPNFHMWIIIPKEVDGLKEVEKNLKNIKLDFNDITNSFQVKVNLYLPKFKVETSLDLKAHLEELGMVEAFSDYANFKGISNENLKVSNVIQKTFIEVNEKGTEATAITAVKLVDRSDSLGEPQYAVVDRPFLYMVVYKDCILFSGRIVNPLEP